MNKMDVTGRDLQDQNFVSIYRGFSYVAEKLEPYTKQGLDKTYHEIYQKAAGESPCQQLCSQVFEGQTLKWCSTCNTWRNYLLKTTRSPKVAWEQTHSWNWPLNSQHIAEVYLPTTWQNKDINFKDISTACFIWENCKRGFNIRHLIIRRIREFRNKYFAHNPSLKISELEKAQVFDVLQDLLRDPDVKDHIDVQECIDGLTNIKQGDPTIRWMKEMQDNLDQHGASLVRIENKLEEDPWCHKHIYNLKQKCLQCIYKQLKTFCQAILTSKTPTCLILMYLIIMVWIKPYEISQLDCISEQYSFPFKQDLPLLGYLSEHEFLAGRKWLIKELEDEVLYTKNETVRAFVVVAELGYGKSALVSNMLCPITSESASILHKHIVAFHVCKFDVRSTHYAERFIRRLVGFLAMKSGEYGNIISMLPESSMLYDRDSCDKEPEACFDQGITIPLKQISEVENVPWLIVVDALDECEHSGNNQILNLLSSRMMQLPKWLRFLIMSRNITSLHTLKKTKIKYLSASDSRNIEDIRAFIYQSLLKDTSSQVIDSLIERSDGNFMYIIYASKLIAEHRDKAGRFFDLPKDLGDIYEINFDRQFEKEHSYTIPKKILEIVCSTLNPLNKQKIFTILKYNGVLEDISEFNSYFQSLSFFLRVGRHVQIAHQALNRWLISEQNGNYRISLQEGHAQISRYLFSTMKNNQLKDLVNLAIHSAESADPTIQKIFVSLKLNDDADFKRKSYLHQLIWRTPSAKALSLLLNYYPEVDVKNEGNVTPAFVASGRGHVEQLELLHRKGADLGFTVSGNFTIRAFNVLRNIEMLKQRFYSGYSLLHIAAQHGHTSVVRYLLKHENSVINKTDTLGLNAGDTACENGHLDVIVIIFNINPKLIGYKCLLHAAKNNHVNVIDWLLRHGIKFNCVSDKDAEVAINVIFGNVPFEHPIAVFPNESNTYILNTVNPLDEWWTIFKINPIHIAIRMGSNDVAEYLISKFPDELNCVDAWGYTAALTSVLYNRTDLLPLVKEHLVSDRCGKVSVHIEKLFPYVSEDIDTSVCPEGGGFAHIVALHNVKEVAYFCLKQGLDIEWNKPDNLSNYPIHYAAANNNMMLMVMFERRQFSHENTRALNGSTSFHIAAITGQDYFIYHFSQSFKLSFPDLKDKRNRGLLHYTVMRQFPDNQIRSIDALQYVSMNLFEYFSDKCNHDLNSLDDYGRSVLHYALRYGHYRVILYLKQSHPIVFNTMLYKRDNAGLNPIRYALLEYEEGSQSLVLPKNCAFFNVFSTLCANSTDFSRILSPFERGLIYLTESFTPSQFFQFLEPDLEHIVKKSVYLLVHVLATNYKHINVHILKGILMITYKHDPFMKFKHLAIARYKPEVFLVCGKLLSKSPLHFLMLNGEFKHSVFSFNQRGVDFYLDLIFRTNRSLLSCEDSKGYNVFHYSLIGGNIMAGRILMRRNINTLNNHISFKDVFMLALLSRENSDPDNFMNCNRESFYQSQEDCTDIFLLEYFKTNRKHLLPIDFCKNRSSELSLVHLLSANGMKQTLEIVVDTFGSDVLSCRNTHSITPLYLGKLFDQTSVVRFIEDRVKFDFPDKDTEEWLLWLLLIVFPDVNDFGNLLCLSHYASFNVLTYRKLRNEFSCLEKILMKIYLVSDKTIIQAKVYLHFTLDSLQYLLLRFDSFENALHSHDRQECMNLHLLLSQSYQGLEYLCLLNKTYTLSETTLYKTSKRLRQKFKIIVDKADIAVKRYLQKFPTDLCHTSNASMRKGKMIYMYKSATNIFYLMRNWLKEAAIHLLMQASKSVKVEVRGDFAFLRERMHVLKFPTSDKEKQHGAVALITDSLIYINKYKYLHILKPSLVYKDLKRKVSRDYFGRHDFPKFETKILEFINLREPFKHFQNQSSFAKSQFYN